MAATHHDVVRLDVAVHHALLVRVRQRVGHLAQESHRLVHRQLALARQLRAEGLAFDERHHVPQEVARRVRAQQRYHVRVLKPGSELDLATEAVLVDTRRHLRRQDLDDHPPRQLHVLGQEDAAHAAPTQFALDAEVWSQCFRQPLREVVQTNLPQVDVAPS